MSTSKCTEAMRWQVRTYREIQNVISQVAPKVFTIQVMQQAWIDMETGKATWIDVPVVDRNEKLIDIPTEYDGYEEVLSKPH